MPKMKTNKSVASRFKATGTGKLMCRHPGRRHKLEKKSSKRKRHLAQPLPVHETLLRTYKRMMGVS